MPSHFTSVRFKNYKAFHSYSVTLGGFNILVGPNNAGKSTVIGAFRILAEGFRRAESRKADYVDTAAVRGWCYPVNLRDLPVSTENVFTNYDESEPAIVEFRISNGNKLRLVFSERDVCHMVCETTGKPVTSPAEFLRAFDVAISFVPVLGPVEHNEELFQREAARKALLTHRASRNFRNIWHHYPDDFEKFRVTIQETWPGMDIQLPEITRDGADARLHMFCPEDRYPREIFWAGFGFQVWCQMLTFITKAKPGSLLIVDEPDIYLHSDLQRQLVHLLRERDGDVLIATHSTEILSEAEAGDIVVLNRKWKAARRIQQPSQMQAVFGSLGSNMNPMLTQLAKTKKVVFVEGDDFSLLAAFCRKLGRSALANRASFAVVPARGFNPARVRDFSEGIQTTLGVDIAKAVVFDRDYRSADTVEQLKKSFQETCAIVHIHDRKEIENFVLVAPALDRAIKSRIADRRSRGISVSEYSDDILQVLTDLTNQLKSAVFGQLSEAGAAAIRSISPSTSIATANAAVHDEFEREWTSVDSRLRLVPGKLLLSKLNDYLQKKYQITVTPTLIIGLMQPSEVPADMKVLVESLHQFSAITG